MDAETIIRELGLRPHPEGGFYRETYRSGEKIAAAALPLDMARSGIFRRRSIIC